MAIRITVPVHDVNAFDVGQKVRVIRRVERAKGWDNIWTVSMDQSIGKTGVIISNIDRTGILVDGDAGGFRYPSPALELDTGEPTVDEPRLRLAGINLEKAAGKTVAAMKAGAKEDKEKVLETITRGEPALGRTKKKAKKRIRVGPGPWDKAPCTHLRWHLMGFFREKLALVKSTVIVDGKELTVAEVDVECAKCKTKMTLQAK